MDEAKALISALGISIVILSMALHRRPSQGFKAPAMYQDLYSIRVASFIEQLKVLLLKDPVRPLSQEPCATRFISPQIWYWEHQRLRADPPATVAQDGVHLSSRGTERLLHSIRAACWSSMDCIKNMVQGH